MTEILRRAAETATACDTMHLTLDDVRHAVFDASLPEDSPVLAHLNSCSICSSLVQRERENNPLIRLAEASANQDAFWQALEELLDSLEN